MQVPFFLNRFKVLVLSAEGGMIEPVCNALSLHQIKKRSKGSLLDYFMQVILSFGTPLSQQAEVYVFSCP